MLHVFGECNIISQHSQNLLQFAEDSDDTGCQKKESTQEEAMGSEGKVFVYGKLVTIQRGFQKSGLHFTVTV